MFVFGASAEPEKYNFTDTKTVIINHNLGYFPWAWIILNDNIQSLGTIQHNSTNQLTVTFQNSQSGAVYIR